jgi:hypothetical protein
VKRANHIVGDARAGDRSHLRGLKGKIGRAPGWRGALLAQAVLLATGLHAAVPATQPAKPAVASPYRPDRFAGAAGRFYRLRWGVDSLSVKWTESGEVIRFAYKVLDADKARILNDKKYEPSLIDPEARVKLVIPALENIGQLRQTSTPENGKSYWMAFSNRGRLVKRGHRVTIEIGEFRAEGLVVD